jgi:DNA-binding PadR family transcriptional regulator
MALRFAILGLLAETPQTGYQLKSSFDGSVGYFWQAKFQQIYTELKRLEREGLVAGEVIPQEGKPTKTIYALTAKGDAALKAWVDTPSAPHPVRDEFLVKVFSINRLSPQRALERFLEHRHHHEERLAAYRAIEARLEEAGWVSGDAIDPALLGRYLTLRRGIGYERDCLAWCDWAIEVLRRRQVPRRTTRRRGQRARSR